MSYNIFRIIKWQFAATVVFALGVQLASASNSPLISGSYEVVRTTTVGAQAKIQMRIHLVNHGSSQLSIQRMTIWDFSHADKGGSQACAVDLRAHASADTTQEFTLQAADYRLWQRGFRPRLVLQLGSSYSGSPKSTAVVRLDRISVQEAK